MRKFIYRRPDQTLTDEFNQGQVLRYAEAGAFTMYELLELVPRAVKTVQVITEKQEIV